MDRVRTPCRWLVAALCLLAGAARGEAGDLQIFGFFQNAFMHQTGYEVVGFESTARSSFSVQQHNLFFQKDLDPRWRAFVNYEFLNSFSSARNWGSASLEEAWVRYRADARFNLKLGLLIPIFNNLNEIKNRTPVLPYIIRPLVYETSYSEFIATEEFLPSRAYAQVHGFLPVGERKLDYAVFLGNGPNISDDTEFGQTGVDTTTSFLVGGRLGLRQGDWKAGVSWSRDHYNSPVSRMTIAGQERSLEQVTRRRLGADLSCLWRDLSFEGEVIVVDYDDDDPSIDLGKEFAYGTLGYRIDDRWFVYGSWWRTEEDFLQALPHTGEVLAGTEHVNVYTVGLSCQLRDSIVVKAQFAPVDLDAAGAAIDGSGIRLEYDSGFHHLSTSVSVVF